MVQNMATTAAVAAILLLLLLCTAASATDSTTLSQPAIFVINDCEMVRPPSNNGAESTWSSAAFIERLRAELLNMSGHIILKVPKHAHVQRFGCRAFIRGVLDTEAILAAFGKVGPVTRAISATAAAFDASSTESNENTLFLARELIAARVGSVIRARASRKPTATREAVDSGDNDSVTVLFDLDLDVVFRTQHIPGSIRAAGDLAVRTAAAAAAPPQEPFAETGHGTTTSLDAQLPRHLDAITLPYGDNVFSKPASFAGKAPGHVYVIDSGIRASHVEFLLDCDDPGSGTRVTEIYDAYSGYPDACYDHGSHVSALVAGCNVGVSPDALVFFARVLDCDGYGSLGTVVTGLYAVLDHCRTTEATRASGIVVNLSLGTSSSSQSGITSLATVFNLLRTDCGANIVVAAGNDASDACYTLPAGLVANQNGRVVSVAAADVSTQTFASFSNRGVCTTIMAPGVNVLSAASTGGDSTYVYISGTSMATPLAAGALLELMKQQPSEWYSTAADRVKNNAVFYSEVARQQMLRTAAYNYIRSVPNPTQTTSLFLQLTPESAIPAEEPFAQKPPSNTDKGTTSVITDPARRKNTASSAGNSIQAVEEDRMILKFNAFVCFVFIMVANLAISIW